MIIVSGFFEPVFYLLRHRLRPGRRSSGTSRRHPVLGLRRAGPDGDRGDERGPLRVDVNLFFKLRYAKTYDAILSTPLGPPDVAAARWPGRSSGGCSTRGRSSSSCSLLGLILSPWAILALPGALLIGLGFRGGGHRGDDVDAEWQDFDLVTVVTLPLFLFCATFFPISVYPEALEWVVRVLPLYHGIELDPDARDRDASRPFQLLNVAYLLTMGLVGMCSRRSGSTGCC